MTGQSRAKVRFGFSLAKLDSRLALFYPLEAVPRQECLRFEKRAGLSPRVLWANVGNTFEAMLRRIEGVSGPSLRLKEARRLLDERDWGGVPNPLFGVVRYATEYKTPIRFRRVCCLQYRLPDRCFCKACRVDEAHRAQHN